MSGGEKPGIAGNRRTDMKEWIETNKEMEARYARIMKECTLHHSAHCRVYVSRHLTIGYIKPYKGKFGEGFAIYKPNWESTRYSVVEYWIYK